jgi:hypothetical protein
MPAVQLAAMFYMRTTSMPTMGMPYTSNINSSETTENRTHVDTIFCTQEERPEVM